MTGAEIIEIVKTIISIVVVFFLGWLAKDFQTINKIADCEQAKKLVSKRGRFKYKGKMLEGKVLFAEIDRPVVIVEVDGEEGWYIIRAKKFKPFDKEGTNDIRRSN